MTALEILLLAPLIGLSIGVIVYAWFQSPAHLWSPLVMYTILMLYYMIIGPLLFVYSEQTVFLGVDYRSIYWKGWLASLVAFVSFIAGYAIPRQPKRLRIETFDDPRLFYTSLTLGVFSFICMAIWAVLSGRGLGMFNPLASQAAYAAEMTGSINPFISYFLYAGNLIIPGMVVLLLFWLDSKLLPVFLVLGIVWVLAMLFFVNTGFRYRIAWTAIALNAAYYLWRRKRPNKIIMSVLVVLFLMVMGLIGMTRNYFSGLSLERASQASAGDMLQSGFSEAGIFISVCAVVDGVPDRYPLTYFDPLIVTAAYPIPSVIWPNKPRSETLTIMAAAFESRDAFSAGQAVPYFGEWYIAFWWPGLIGSSLLLGYAAKKLWFWYGQRMKDKLATAIYCACLGYLYVFFGRGYLPQTTMNFCFTVLPLFFIYQYFRKRPLPAAARRRMRERVLSGRLFGTEKLAN